MTKSPGIKLVGAERREVLDDTLNKSLPTVALGLSMLWVVLSVGHYAVLEGQARIAMLTASITTTVALFLLWLVLRTIGPFSSANAHPIGSVILLVLACNSMLHILVTANPNQSTNVGILIVSVGCFFMSLRWLVAAISMILAAWAIAMAQIATPGDWIHYGFMNVIATALAVLVLRTHVRLVLEAQGALKEQAAQAEQLRELSNTDQLTGLANRRAFDAAINREWQRSARTHRPISVIIMDIDFFKSFNDHYGHLEGDECLARVATTLHDSFRRAPDFLGRYGGEEFIAILPETTREDAIAIAEQCREAIENERIPHAGSANARTSIVTMSFGVATASDARNGTAANLVKEADKALYAAKDAGRNRVVAA